MERFVAPTKQALSDGRSDDRREEESARARGQLRSARRFLLPVLLGMTGYAMLPALCLVVTGGCALFEPSAAPKPSEPPKPITVRFHLTATQEHEGYRAGADENGQPLYVAPASFLTENDVSRATVFASRQRYLVELEFRGFAAARLEQSTRENLGGRLAVFIDDRLIMSPRLLRPIAGGKVYLNGDFTRAQADEIVHRLTRMPASAPATRAPSQ